MMAKEYKLKISDSHEMQVYEWFPDENIELLGVLQISHGMTEHGKRYQHFAKFLNNNGFAVYASDHRGHGKTAGSEEKLGHFSDNDGWNKVVNDLKQVSKHIKEKHPDLPFYILGHSMGSFLVRDYLIKPPFKLNGVILSGTAGDPGILGQIGLMLTKFTLLFKKKNKASKMMNQLSFGSYNKSFKPNRTKFDWLSRDNEQVDKYIEDPLCGFICSIKFFEDLLTGLLKVNQKETFNKIAEDLPIYLISGGKDPVGNNGRGVNQVYSNFKKAGVKNITMKLYSEGRHEMLNEINKEEVYSNILTWMSKNRY